VPCSKQAHTWCGKRTVRVNAPNVDVQTGNVERWPGLTCRIGTRGRALDHEILWDSGEELAGGKFDPVGRTSAADPRRPSIGFLAAIRFDPEPRLFEIVRHDDDQLQSASWPSPERVGRKSVT
jgi:hypothetical protein